MYNVYIIAQVALVVNVASKWGYTDRDYKELNELQNVFSDNLAILAFPCNQFGEEVCFE